MRIGVVSDTHMPSRANGIPKELAEGLKGVDLIVHAGDWVAPDVADLLEEIAPVEGVSGNNDGEEIRARFGRKKILQLAGFKIGVVHGDGSKWTTEKRAREAFRNETVDIIIFGHSHAPYREEVEGALLFNPGSPTDKRRQPLFSYGILELGQTLEARHFFYPDKSWN
ncbi:metallophosphoesterase [Aneurinibacillus sp. Ricciae_BoGa-3]|uniref:metallophosphoesterase family protein n=1 Tax=Aneurinibacillus sp. Ricciae_BoGa-3 TaxID=3022697 RepID=UPI002341BD3F|nr:metallophosphoesterase [Aneurinibacillus sp. Ricciae_BoGa-3]WCK56822.1 metallophosphoesterase [Aneurinibacillus sp. Ricciae_BoGa-3]